MWIRRERRSDRPAITEVVRRAFDDRDAEPELVERIRASDRFVPELSLVADDDGMVVGHVMVSYVDLDAEDREATRVLLLSPLAVLPERQGEGIGSALIQAAMAGAERMGEPLVLVEGVPALYPRFGFRPAAPLGLLPPRDGIPDEAWMAKPLSSYLPELRGRVRYPEAFDVVD